MAHVARRIIGLVVGDGAQDLIEYALLVSLIAMVALIAVASVGSAVNNVLWNTVANGLSGAL